MYVGNNGQFHPSYSKVIYVPQSITDIKTYELTWSSYFMEEMYNYGSIYHILP